MSVEERVYRKLIHALLDRYPITQIDGKVFRFFRKDEEYTEEDGSVFKILETGVFQRCEVRTVTDQIDGYRWIRIMNIDQIDHVMPTDERELERLYYDLSFMIVMNNEKIKS